MPPPEKLMSRILAVAGISAVSLVVLAAIPAPPAPPAHPAAPAPPTFIVNKLWPLPLPEHWVLGSITGIAIDQQDHLYVAQRAASVNTRTEAGLMTTPPSAEACCKTAPPILQFDADGKLLGTWGGAGNGYDWPVSTGAIVVDASNNVWITAAGVPEAAAPAAGATGVVAGGSGRGGATGGAAAPSGPPGDAQILVFTSAGRFVRQIGKPGATDAGNNANLDKPQDVAVDVGSNEVYVADGGAHQRVVVLDATNGAFKRAWSGHGQPFQRLSSIALSKDGVVYVGDRRGNRVQTFRKDGRFIGEVALAPNTLGNGSVWDVALSSDAAQEYLFVADGQNEQVHIYDRKTLAPVGAFGGGGRWPGRFYAVNSLTMDSRGNVYTGEGYEGKRVQKFTTGASRTVAAAGHAQGDGDSVMAPKFEVDPAFPKALPSNWVLGMSVGVAVDADDHVWMVHRPPTISPNERGADQSPALGACCIAAPPVLEFDQAGNVLRHWGGAVAGAPYEWPESNHGISIDYKGNVWIGANAANDAQILKFSRDGKFIMQVGHAGKSRGSNDSVNFGAPAKIVVDAKTNEAYVADGYKNHRVVVIDAETGKFKRFWSAYGNKPSDEPLGVYVPGETPKQTFRGPVHCAMPSNDGLVYVCDRQSNRIQVFKNDGSFVKEVFFATQTGGDGAVWDIAFSPDAAQKYLYVADGKNERVYIVDRAAMTTLSSFGDGGRQPGQWFGAHSIATDSKGNIYTVETYEGRRLQKFVYKGVQKVAKWQGVPWPGK
jgi:DNA-binding beta-propeller fold protein YncE